MSSQALRICHPEGSQEPSATGMGKIVNSYEQQREDRIRRNTDKLIEMGILTAASALNAAVLRHRSGHTSAAAAISRRKASSKPAQGVKPPRRSSRLKEEAPAKLGSDNIEPARVIRTRAAPVRSADAQGPAALHEHNLYRIRTMPEKALRRRIYTIKRCDKLQSYVQTLRDCEMDELADEAQQRLKEDFALA